MTTVIRISFLGRQHVPASQTFHLKLAAAIALPDAVDVRHHQVVAVWHVRLSQPHCHCRVAIPKDSTAAPRSPALRPSRWIKALEAIKGHETNEDSFLSPALGGLRMAARTYQIAVCRADIFH
jgi:hypothetical protein